MGNLRHSNIGPNPGRNTGLKAIAIAATGLLATTTYARADDVADFYKGKTLTMVIGLSPGGGYDTYARLVIRHLVNHIPGKPDYIAKNMTGAGGMVAANFLYNVAPRDGSMIEAPQRGVPFEPITAGKASKAHFDPLKFNWIGSANSETSVAVAWHTTGIDSYKDLYTKPLVVGGTGAGTESVVMPYVLRNILGLKLRVIAGYPGGSEVNLAMERGEVGGRGTFSWSSVKSEHMDWVKQKKINILYQQGLEKNPDLPNVPLVLDLAKNEMDRRVLELEFTPLQFGRPYMAPPDVPKERIAALRKAFDETMKDKAFLADAEKRRLDITPVSGAKLQAILERAYSAPPEVVERLAEASKRQPDLKVLKSEKK